MLNAIFSFLNEFEVRLRAGLSFLSGIFEGNEQASRCKNGSRRWNMTRVSSSLVRVAPQLLTTSNFIWPWYHAALLFLGLGSIVLLFGVLFSQQIREDLVRAATSPASTAVWWAGKTTPAARHARHVSLRHAILRSLACSFTSTIPERKERLLVV